MGSLDSSNVKTPTQRPYRSLREDPRYAEIKRIIDEFPAEKMDQLRSFINRWLRRS